MTTPTMSELAVRLVDTVTPWLDSDEQTLLHMGLGAATSRQVIAVALDFAAQKQFVLPAGLLEEIANQQRKQPNRHRAFYGTTVKKAG
ncbi:MAG TPA: hypothetical protein VFR17_02720 [Mycobacterium sp.]|nr:hypothetical protein [Mycobacterium sp.]